MNPSSEFDNLEKSSIAMGKIDLTHLQGWSLLGWSKASSKLPSSSNSSNSAIIAISKSGSRAVSFAGNVCSNFQAGWEFPTGTSLGFQSKIGVDGFGNGGLSAVPRDNLGEIGHE